MSKAKFGYEITIERLAAENAALRERCAAAESKEVCTVAHSDEVMAFCPYCKIESLRSRLAEAEVATGATMIKMLELNDRLVEAEALLRAIRGETIDAWDAEMIWLPRIDAYLSREQP